jgi:protease I
MRALILAAEGVEDCELLYPYYRLQEEGFDVDLAGPNVGPIACKHGYTARANLAFSNIDPENYDLLILPGGKAPETVRLDRYAVAVTRKMFESGKPVAAICHGIQTLISAGVLRGRSATCWAGVRDDVKAAGGNYSDREVVVDGNLITSRCPEDLPAFCREIFQMLHAEVSH